MPCYEQSTIDSNLKNGWTMGRIELPAKVVLQSIADIKQEAPLANTDKTNTDAPSQSDGDWLKERKTIVKKTRKRKV
jgi:hypothetical protein